MKEVKSSTYYFHMKAEILADFQICISVPLNLGDGSEDFALYLKLKPLVYRSTYLSLLLKKIILTIHAEWHL